MSNEKPDATPKNSTSTIFSALFRLSSVAMTKKHDPNYQYKDQARKNLNTADPHNISAIQGINQFYDEENVPLGKYAEKALTKQVKEQNELQQKGANPLEKFVASTHHESTISHAFGKDNHTVHDTIGKAVHTTKGFVEKAALLSGNENDPDVASIYAPLSFRP